MLDQGFIQDSLLGRGDFLNLCTSLVIGKDTKRAVIKASGPTSTGPLLLTIHLSNVEQVLKH